MGEGGVVSVADHPEQVGEVARASLALWDQTVPDGVCPRSLGRRVNIDTGEWFFDRCKRHSCEVCGPKAAFVTALAIGLVEPERFVRFSLVGEDWQTVRRRVRRVAFELRHEGFSWNCCWHVERNPRGTGHHVHAYQWGDFVAQSKLQTVCSGNGMGYPDIRKWEQVGTRGTMYGMKHAVGYGMKGASTREGLSEYLALNGGRLVHASRGFWREGRDGPRINGIDGARAVALERVYGPRERGGVWKLIPWREAA